MSAQPLDVRIAHLEGAYEQIDKRLGDLTATVNGRFAQVDSRFAQIDARLDALNDKIDDRFGGLQWRMTSLIIGTWITTILVVLLHH
jgi:tetrahydromethanopterin S-methyltransferase subunit G